MGAGGAPPGAQHEACGSQREPGVRPNQAKGTPETSRGEPEGQDMFYFLVKHFFIPPMNYPVS